MNLILCLRHLLISFFSNNEDKDVEINKYGAKSIQDPPKYDIYSCIKMGFRCQLTNWYCSVGSKLNNQITGIHTRADAASFSASFILHFNQW